MITTNFYTKQANDADEDGVLSGNWSGEYAGGKKPWEWQGSLLILKQYLESGEPVKFGQCWVFSGILTSCKYLIFTLKLHQGQLVDDLV